MVSTRKWLTVEQAAEHLSLSVRTIRQYRATGKLPAYKVAGERALRFRVEDVDALMELAEPTRGDEDTPELVGSARR